MSIKENSGKVKDFFLANEKEMFFGLLLVIVALLAFGLGRLSKIEEAKVPIRIENALATSTAEADIPSVAEPTATKEATNVVAEVATPEYQMGSVIVSSRGKKYHFPWCPGAKTIKASNRLVLTEAEAKAKGYTLASGCSAVSGE